MPERVIADLAAFAQHPRDDRLIIGHPVASIKNVAAPPCSFSASRISGVTREFGPSSYVIATISQVGSMIRPCLQAQQSRGIRVDMSIILFSGITAISALNFLCAERKHDAQFILTQNNPA